MIVVDVETTGLDSTKNSIVSIGAVDFQNPRNQFYQECRIWDGAEIMDEALTVNGFTREEITNLSKPSLEEIMKKFILWAEKIEERTLAGEDPARFDVPFLIHSSEKYGIRWIFGRRTVDLHSECYNHHLLRGLVPPIKNNVSDLNLDKTLVYSGLQPEPKPHNGLNGAKLEAEAFSRLIHGKNLFREYAKFEIPEYLKK